MVFEWADYGSLRELYCKYDIAWRTKVEIALDICRGLTFLHSCDILHHDIRCAHILVRFNNSTNNIYADSNKFHLNFYFYL